VFDLQSKTQSDAADRTAKLTLASSSFSFRGFSVRPKSVHVDISKPRFANERLMLYAIVGISVVTGDGIIDIFFVVSDAKSLSNLIALLGSLLLV